MNQTTNTILTRRSIRAYKDEQISDQELETILEAGRFAPSAMNQQPWHFLVIQNPGMLTQINEACKAGMLNSGNKAMEERVKDPNFSVFYHAPTLIIVSGNVTAIAPQNDCTLAMQNMFLAAEALGIGSCWIHSVIRMGASEEGAAFFRGLGIPEGHQIFTSAAFGYKACDQPSPAPRRDGTVTIMK